MKSGVCYATCTNGECAAKMLNKKKMPKEFSISDSKNVCTHLSSLYANMEVVRNLFPSYFLSNTNTSPESFAEDAYIPQEEEENLEDLNLMANEVLFCQVLQI